MAQNVTISGYVKDASTGETLIGANIYNALIPGQGTATNAYGFYSLTLPKGNYQLVFSYLGYQDHQADVALENDQTLNIQLSEGVAMEEVVVVAEQNDRNVTLPAADGQRGRTCRGAGSPRGAGHGMLQPRVSISRPMAHPLGGAALLHRSEAS